MQFKYPLIFRGKNTQMIEIFSLSWMIRDNLATSKSRYANGTSVKLK